MNDMNRRDFIFLAGGAAGGLFMGGPRESNAAGASASTGPPNILFILTDDQGWSQVSKEMHPDIPESRSAYLNTRNMTRLAREGMRFTSGYSPAPLCTPTRRSILCGMTPARQRGTEFASKFVPSKHLTIPKALKRANPAYRCAHFGKWGSQMASTPEECGYDATDGMTSNATGGIENKEKEFHLDEDPKRTRTVTERAVEFMRAQNKAGRPFYAQVSYYAVHLRVETLQATLKKYQKKGEPDRGYTQAWAAMLEELDAGLGGLLGALDEMGIADRTYVVFMADNGGRGTVPGGDESRLPTNHPLSGAKHSLLEGGIRVPFFARGPGVKSGSVCHTPVVGYDLLPTFYDLAGGKKRLPADIDGGSFAPLLTDPGKKSVKRPLDALVFHRPGRFMSAIRQGDDKLFINWTPQGKIKSRVLSDLKSDPYEQKNLAESKTAKADELQAKLLGYLKKVEARAPQDVSRKKKGR